DAGHTREELVKAVKAAGWDAAIHSSYNHLKDRTDVSKDDHDAWQAEHGNAGPAAYLRARKKMLERVGEGAEIICESASGKEYVIRHQPCPKFRLVICLAKPFEAAAFADQDDFVYEWRRAIVAASEYLGIAVDEACVDASRLFYLPRHADEAGKARFEF